MPLQFNMLHVLPSSKIPVGTLPIDSFIANHLNLMKKKDQGRDAMAAVSQSVTSLNQQRRELEDQALEQGLFMVPEFQFEHCFYQMSHDNFRNEPANAIVDIY